MGKTYYYTLKKNRLVDVSTTTEPAYDYKRIDEISWNKQELAHGKTVGIKKFPKKYTRFLKN